MENKVVSIKKYQKNKGNKMLFIIIIFSFMAASLIWKYKIEEQSLLDVEIPKSSEIFYNNQTPIASTTAQIMAEFDKHEGKPVLFYIYTTWCGVCKKNFATINEIAREFQNTDLKVIAIAIDKDLEGQKLMEYLDSFGNFYFEPVFLSHKEGFAEFLHKKGIKYRGVIPFTTLIGGDGRVKAKYNGVKSKNYLRNKVVKELFS